MTSFVYFMALNTYTRLPVSIIFFLFILSSIILSPLYGHADNSPRRVPVYTHDYDFFITNPLSLCPPTLVPSQDILLPCSCILEDKNVLNFET